MSDTPRTDAVLKANNDLGWGGMVSIPDNHPPCDPWELARKLEIENNELKDFAIWMTGCGYDFCQHEYYLKQREKLLKD